MNIEDFLDSLVAGQIVSKPELVRLKEGLGYPTGVFQFPQRTVEGGEAERTRQLRAVSSIGSYQLVETIDQNDCGGVFLVEPHSEPGKRMLLKLVRSDCEDESHSYRWIHRARLQHPNVAELLDGGTASEGYRYVLIEHVQGQRIDDYCDRHRLTLEERLRLFLRICSALDLAHQHLIHHLDLRETNVVVTSEGVPKLLPGFVVGQVALSGDYASPEQRQGNALSAASDVYALGVLAHRLLTGTLPVVHDEGDSPAKPSEILAGMAPPKAADISQARQTRPSRLRRRLMGDLDAVLCKALQREPEERYATVRAFSDDLERHLETLPVAAVQGGLIYRAAKFATRSWPWLLAALSGAVLAVAFVVSITTERQRAEEQAQRAEAQSRRAEGEARRAEALKEFLQHVLTSPNPDEGRGLTVDEVLEDAASKIETLLPGQPELQAAARETIGSTFLGRGRYDAAERLLRDALEARLALFGSSSNEVARSQALLGRFHMEQGEFDEAKVLLEQAWRTRRHLFGTDHIETAGALDDLAHLYVRQSDFSAAERVRREALAIRQRALGDEDFKTAETKFNLARVLLGQAKYGESEALMREVLQYDRQQHGDDHPIVASSLNNLGMLLVTLGQYDEAARHLRRALEIERRALGERHPAVAGDLNNLALARRGEGDLVAAESLLQEALVIYRELFGQEHPDVARATHNLGVVAMEQGRLAAADQLLREAMRTRLEVLEADHLDVAASRDQVGALLLKKGNLEGAEPLLRAALLSRRKNLPPDHPLIAASVRHLGQLRHAQGLLHQAELLYREALAIRLRVLGKDHPDVAESREDLGRLGDREPAPLEATGSEASQPYDPIPPTTRSR